MKKIRVLTAVTLSLCLILAQFSLGAGATDVNAQEEFVRGFEDIYSQKQEVSYQVLDDEGNDITDKFVSDTGDWYRQQNWNQIYEYFFANVEKVTEVRASQTKRADLTKTVTERVQMFCKWTGDMDPVYPGITDRNNDGWASYYVRGSITYDPNTFVVTSIGTPIRVTDIEKVSGWQLDLVPAIYNESYTKGSAGGMQGQYTYRVAVESIVNVDGFLMARLTYGTYAETLTITPEG